MRHHPQPSGAVTITTPMIPPEWALLERELIRTQAQAIEAFYNHYFDERGSSNGFAHFPCGGGGRARQRLETA